MNDSRQGRIVKIFGPREIVMDVGTDHGVSEHYGYLIYRAGEEIRDLDTGDVIERIEHPVVRARVKHAQRSITTLVPLDDDLADDAAAADSGEGPYREAAPKPPHSPFDDVQVGDLVRADGAP